MAGGSKSGSSKSSPLKKKSPKDKVFEDCRNVSSSKNVGRVPQRVIPLDPLPTRPRKDDNMSRNLKLDVLDLFKSHSGIWFKDRLVEKGIHGMFGHNNWWYLKGVVEVFKNQIRLHSWPLYLALGPCVNAPTVAIDRVYISR